MPDLSPANIREQLEEILDEHAKYYIQQTMKFFQENGESPALSKNNEGDLKAKQAILTTLSSAIEGCLPEKQPDKIIEQGADGVNIVQTNPYNQALEDIRDNLMRILK